MDDSTIEPTNQKQRRSRNGCQECRRLHRKCSESRPACTNCVVAGKTCTYAKLLSWGGRPFQKSCFGTTDAVKVNISNAVSSTESSSKKQSFIYSMPEPTAQAQARPITSDLTPSPALSEIYLNPDWLSNLSKVQQNLLRHFFQHSMRLFSAHPVMYEKLGAVLLPMALQDHEGSHLLSAILYASTVHQTYLRPVRDQEQVLALKYNSIRLLRQQIDNQNSTLVDVRIATSLVLCLADIIAGSEQPDSWRTHLYGALAMLELPSTDGVCHQCRQNSVDGQSARVVLKRWCTSFELVTLISGHASKSSAIADLCMCCIDNPYISMIDGFSTTLIPVFKEIDQLFEDTRAISAHQTTDDECMPSDLAANAIDQRSDSLANRIDVMLRDPVRRLDPWIEPSRQTEATLRLFSLIDRTYHYAALLQVFQIMGKECTDTHVISTLDTMIQCFDAIAQCEGPRSGVATLYPIFIAGCNSDEPTHREFVLNWISEMIHRLEIGNIDRARQFLIDLWCQRDSQASEDAYITCDGFQRINKWNLSL